MADQDKKYPGNEIKSEISQRLNQTEKKFSLDDFGARDWEKVERPSSTSYGEVVTVDKSKISWKDRVKENETLGFLRHLSILVESGLSLIKALRLIEMRSNNKILKEHLRDVAKEVEAGSSFWKACSRHPGMFTQLQINMIKAGEIGGSLSAVLVHLADHGEQEQEIKNKVKGALIYPIIVLSIGLVVVYFVLAFVVPMFASFFADSQMEIPLMTRIVCALGEVLASPYSLALIVGIIAFLIIGIQRFSSSDAGRQALDRWYLSVPVFGELLSKSAIIRFSKAFTILLRSGVPIMHALDLVVETTGNYAIGLAMSSMKDEVERGGHLDEPLRKYSFIPSMVPDVIAIGQESGQLPEVIEKLTSKYEREINQLAENIANYIEPFLLVAMGLISLFIVVSLFYPYFSLVQQLPVY